MTFATINEFNKVDPVAAQVMLPYLAWLFYEASVNLYYVVNSQPGQVRGLRGGRAAGRPGEVGPGAGCAPGGAWHPEPANLTTRAPCPIPQGKPGPKVI